MYQKIFPNTKNIYLVFAGIVILLAGYLLTQTINKPFIGHHDWNGVQYGNMARNHVRYGLTQTRLGQIENGGVISPQEFSVNTHHPAALPLLLAISVKLFGTSETAIRLVPIIFSLITIGAIMYLGWQYIHPLAGVCAGLFACSTPMYRYFGNMPVHEPIITALVLLVLIAYLSWRDTRLAWKWLWLAVICVSLVGWPGYYITPLLFLSDIMYKKWIDWHHFLPIFLTQIGLFILHLAHNWWLTGSAFGGGLLEILSMRLLTLTPSEVTETNSLLVFLTHEAKWMWVYFTRIQVVLTFIAVILLVAMLIKNPLKTLKTLNIFYVLILLLFYGVFHALLFRNAAFIHEYMLFYLIPGIALASSWSSYAVLSKVLKHRVFLTGIVIFVLGIISFFERNEFINALQKTDMHLIGKQVGEEIATLSKQDTNVFLLVRPVYNMVYSKFTQYYSDRFIRGITSEAIESMSANSLVVVVKGYEPENFDALGFNEGERILFKVKE